MICGIDLPCHTLLVIVFHDFIERNSSKELLAALTDTVSCGSIVTEGLNAAVLAQGLILKKKIFLLTFSSFIASGHLEPGDPPLYITGSWWPILVQIFWQIIREAVTSSMLLQYFLLLQYSLRLRRDSIGVKFRALLSAASIFSTMYN